MIKAIISIFVIILIIFVIFPILRRKESFSTNVLNDDNTIVFKIRDTTTRKVYVVLIDGEKYVWKYTKELHAIDLHKFCKKYPYINFKGVTDIIGITRIDGLDGVLMPYIPKGQIDNIEYNKKTILKLIDVVSFLDVNGFYANPTVSNILIDNNNNPHIINYFSDTILKNGSKKSMKKTLINTIISLKFKMDEDKVLSYIDKIRVPYRVFNFMKNKCDIEYHHITEWIQDL